MPSARTRDDLPPAAPRYDAYFGLLVISLVATLTGLVFLYLDYKSYPENVPNAKQVAAAAMTPATPAEQPAAAPAARQPATNAPRGGAAGNPMLTPPGNAGAGQPVRPMQ